jgi:NADPH-dependent 2,4-dienoyl-CoA reductase/sulfur reductase-like enzyme
MTTRNVLIVGSSLAGLRTAEALRSQGYDGAITMVDAEPEPRYDRPPLSKEYLSRGNPSADPADGGQVGRGPLLRAPEALAALGADWYLGESAVSLNPRSREIGLASGGTLGYDKLVIATGVTPVWPAALQIASAMTLRTRQDADRLRALMASGVRLAVIGAGFIGLEVAATFRAAGAEVDVVEAEQAPLTRQLGPVVGRAIQAVHELRGVRFHLGTRATAVCQDGAGCRVELPGGAVIEADVLLVAVGSAPAVGWLRGSGLDLDNGIACDGHLLAAPDVYAVGDVARWPHPLAGRPVRIEHWTNAIEQAAHVARRITDPDGEIEPFATVPYFWSDQYGSRLQAYGFPGVADEVEVFAGDLDSGKFAALYRSGGRLTAAVGIGSPRQVLVGRRQVVAELTAQGPCHEGRQACTRQGESDDR